MGAVYLRAASAALAAVAVSSIALSSVVIPSPAAAQAVPVCPNPVEVQGFKTCADVEKAKREGEVVLYSPDIEQGTVKLLAAFNRAFPMIKTSYVRLQAGALYARIMAERQAGSYLADVINISDVGLVLDFQKRGAYAAYGSPQFAAYKPEYLSKPEGYWAWGAVILSGFVYNSRTMPAGEAPKDWSDLTDPKWAGTFSMKSSNSGLQSVTWYVLKNKLGDKYWDAIARQKPRLFDSYVQQYDRVVNGEDKVAAAAQYSGYLEFMHRGAPVAFVFPESGSPVGPEVWGVVKEAPHPQAARLLYDWLLSPVGQKAYADSTFMQSVREDVEPPAGARPINEIKLLMPGDWAAYLGTRREFVRLWSSMSGLR